MKRCYAPDSPTTWWILDIVVALHCPSGKEAARRIFTLDPAAKLIVSSGYCDEPVMRKFRKYGFSAALPKPYTIGELEEAITGIFPAMGSGQPTPGEGEK